VITPPSGEPAFKVWNAFAPAALWVIYAPTGPIWGRGQDALDAALAALKGVDQAALPPIPQLD
jgi:hypothetical protein